MEPQRNSRFDHVYVVLRLDAEMAQLENQVTVTKVFASEPEARAEAERLTVENASRGARYVVQIGRMARAATSA